MRCVVSLLSLVCVVIIYFADQPGHYVLARDYLRTTAHHILYDKDVSVSGTGVLSTGDVSLMLPLHEWLPYWHVNAPVIRAGLIQSPLIQDAKIERCSFFSWSCFNVSIEERKPAFFAIVGGQGWVVGRDGGLIKPISAERIARYVQAGDVDSSSPGFVSTAVRLKIPVISGLLTADASPDVVRVRFGYLRRAMDVIEGVVGVPVSNLELSSANEIKVRFFGLGMTAVFDISAEDLWQEKPEKLTDRALRLKKLLEEFGTNRDRITSVDLAFDKIAVVTTR